VDVLGVKLLAVGFLMVGHLVFNVYQKCCAMAKMHHQIRFWPNFPLRATTQAVWGSVVSPKAVSGRGKPWECTR